jgi:hypothetical protein
MSGRAVLVVEVSREAYKTIGRDDVLAYIQRRDGGPWAIRGPRGGRYISDGPITWQVDEGAFFGPDLVRVIATRPPSSLTYVRPTAKRRMERFEALS